MMTQSYYGGDYETYHRPSQRAPSTAASAYYERPNPYTHSYYDSPHQEIRSEYISRNIQEQASEHGPAGLQRRRIQVACSRCRRRKIKCTGDPGDGSGCSACRSAGADRSTCTFIRVGSHTLSTQVLDVSSGTGSTRATTPTSATYNTETSISSYDNSLYQTHHRPSLPVLAGRSYPDYDPYATSPVDDYPYGSSSSLPRQPSYPSNYGAESFRPWTAGTVSAPVTSTSTYYEPGAAFTFNNNIQTGPSYTPNNNIQTGPSYTPNNNIQTGPSYTPAPGTHLPSVAAEAFSPLNMASMHSSLPSQTVQERRLPPLPYTPSYSHRQPSIATTEVPEIRPLASFTEPRAHINGIYSRTGMPWNTDASSGYTTTRTGSLSSLPMPQTGPTNSTSGNNTSSSYTNDPILGYQFSSSTDSPAISPTSGPTSSENYSGASTSNGTSSSMLPPSSRRHVSRGTSSSYRNLPSLTGGDDYHHRTSSSSSSREAAASLYSFSTGIDPSPIVSDRVSSERHTLRHYNHNDQQPSSQKSQHGGDRQQSYSTHRQSQPQHAASVDELRSRSSYDQQQRAATAHRMSVSNLNARY